MQQFCNNIVLLTQQYKLRQSLRDQTTHEDWSTHWTENTEYENRKISQIIFHHENVTSFMYVNKSSPYDHSQCIEFRTSETFRVIKSQKRKKRMFNRKKWQLNAWRQSVHISTTLNNQKSRSFHGHGLVRSLSRVLHQCFTKSSMLQLRCIVIYNTALRTRLILCSKPETAQP